MRVQLLQESNSAAYRALRFASINESPELSCPEIVRELAIYTRIGVGLLANYPVPARECSSGARSRKSA